MTNMGARETLANDGGSGITSDGDDSDVVTNGVPTREATIPTTIPVDIPSNIPTDRGASQSSAGSLLPDERSQRIPAIDIRHLTKRYGKARGIEDVNLTVRQGEIFGFIGPNGAGKSTTIRTLLGLVRATSGEASILGCDYVHDRTRMLEQVGYLPSEVFYYDGMRARDLLKYAASFYQVDCSKRIAELAARLDLNLDQKIEDMSLGNRKKVGIVQGLMHSPRLLILDEPTSGLDPLVQRSFFDLIREENARGVTVLFSSHILSEVQRICDRVAIIREGRIVAVRSVAEMRRSAVKRVLLTVTSGKGSEVSKEEVVGKGAAAGESTAYSTACSTACDDVAALQHTLESMAGVRSLTVDANVNRTVSASVGAKLVTGAVTESAAGVAAGGDSPDTTSSVSFLYEGDCNALIATLAGLHLVDIEIVEPTLEEVFMHYYQPEKSQRTAGDR